MKFFYVFLQKYSMVKGVCKNLSFSNDFKNVNLVLAH
jgi:hypothetical protein